MIKALRREVERLKLAVSRLRRPPDEDGEVMPGTGDFARDLAEATAIFDHLFQGAPRPPQATDKALRDTRFFASLHDKYAAEQDAAGPSPADDGCEEVRED